MTDSKGFSLAELLVVLTVIAIAVAVGLPSAAAIRESGRAEAAARLLASRLSEQRFKSVATHATRGLQFRQLSSGWVFREVADGNGNGLRTAEITRGVDRVLFASACSMGTIRSSSPWNTASGVSRESTWLIGERSS